MKDYLVDVPVRVMIWIREDCQRQQFEVLKKARPSTLFLISDGGRNEKEWEAICNNRRMFDEIDWDCKVYKLFEEKNNGMYAMGSKSRNLIWNTVDRCIFLEDDYVPAVSYFRFCAEMLERYKDDERILMVSGMNHLGKYDRVNADYFFSMRGSIWGIATWKRVMDRFGDFGYTNDEYVLETLKQNRPELYKRVRGYMTDKTYGGHVPGAEYFLSIESWLQNRVVVVPKYNLISNIGCTADSAHASELKKMPKSSQRLFNMKTYELDFPLTHAEYVIPDKYYLSRVDRMIGKGHPFLSICRWVETFIRGLIYGDISLTIRSLQVKLSKNKKLEK